mmetsp:Transcript_23474/g.44753  ORF Transcript_23474/g.44753 Transcript_23474/m.44753 type:complete len:90 (-) Transcript_23474:431-700(-)
MQSHTFRPLASLLDNPERTALCSFRQCMHHSKKTAPQLRKCVLAPRPGSGHSGYHWMAQACIVFVTRWIHPIAPRNQVPRWQKDWHMLH